MPNDDEVKVSTFDTVGAWHSIHSVPSLLESPLPPSVPKPFNMITDVNPIVNTAMMKRDANRWLKLLWAIWESYTIKIYILLVISTHMSEDAPVPDFITMKHRRRVSMVIVIVLILIMVLASLIPLLRLLEFEKEMTHVLNVKVDVDLDVGVPYIKAIKPHIIEIERLEAVRTDVITYPGVSVRVMKDDKFLAYDSFVKYTGSGTYNLTVVFKNKPSSGDVLLVIAYIYQDASGGFPDDNEGVRLVWRPGYTPTKSLKVDIQTNGSAATKVENITMTQGGAYSGEYGAFYPGLHCFVRKNGIVVSPEMGVLYDGDSGIYSVDIPILEEVNPGDELEIFVEVWGISDFSYRERHEVVFVWQ